MTTEPNAALVAAAALVGAVALLALVPIVVWTRPRRPRAGASTVELDPEPPALVDLLTDDFAVSSEAAPATLVDLAARRWLEVEAMPDGTVMCRVRRSEGRGELTPYEEQVIELVRRRSVGGEVPLPALTTGQGRGQTTWERSFRNAVIDHAQRLGLCRDRFTHAHALVALVGAGVVAALAWAAGVFEENTEVTVMSAVVIGEALALGGAFAAMEGSRLQRDTDEGLEAAARWLGVRQYLDDHGTFPDQPTAAVMLWDRYLAYATALDLANRVVAEVPLGAEDDHHAWSVASGRWRQVRVRYPRLRPGWGRSPGYALVIGSGMTFAFVRLMMAVSDLVGDAAALAVIPAVAWWGFQGVGGLIDLLGPATEVEGVLLRRRTKRRLLWGWRDAVDGLRGRDREKQPFWFVAVDDGTGDVVAAWSVGPEVYAAAGQQQRVRARITAVRRRVRSIEVLGPVTDAARAEVAPPVDDADLRAAAARLAI